MDFTLPETATAVRDLAADIATKISSDDRVATLEASSAPLDELLWRELAWAGLLALELPEALAGDAAGDLTAVENITVAEQLGRHLARVPFGQHAIAAGPLLARNATTTLATDLLPRMADGTLVATAAVEEDLGDDALSPTTALTRSDRGYLLRGTKINVPYAAAAGLLLVTATDADGVAVAVVDATTDGITVTDARTTGLTPTYHVEFSDVAVDDAHVLHGADVVSDLVDRLTLALCAEQSGVLAAALAATASYAREREQFGRPIGSFQAVAQRLADGYIDVSALSLTTTQAAWMFAQSGSSSDDAATTDHNEIAAAIATAKFWAAESGHRVAHTTVHVHGGVGLDTSHPTHRYFLRAKQNEFTLGSASTALRRLGDALAADPA